MNIYIRDIDADTKSKLEEQAKQKGMSLNKYIIAILEDYALHPSLRNIDDKYKNFVEVLSSAFESTIEKNTEALAENTHFLRELESRLR